MTDEHVRTRTTDFLAGTGMPVEVFYGWFRQGMPTDVASPWRTAIDTLRTALLDAVSQRMSDHPGTPQHERELASLDPTDWERVLEQVGSGRPDGIRLSEYARSLAMETAAAFPEAAFRHRATRVPSGRHNRQQQTRFAHLHPGLGLDEVFSQEPDVDAAAALASERIGWLVIVFALNPTVTFLGLNYVPDSADLNEINFGPLSAEARRRVVRDLKAYQRIHSVTGNVISAVEIMQAGFHSASAIARAPESDFADRTGLPAAEARRYQDAAREGAPRPARRRCANSPDGG